MISLIVNGLNEDHQADTIQSALCTAAHPADIEVISITDGHGVDIDRHTGLLKASHDLCCVADAHLIFTPGWDAKIRDAFNPCNLYCAQCERMTPEDYALNPKHERHFGAVIIPHVQHGIPGVSAIWAKGPPQTPDNCVPCILGGFYAFSRAHYFEALLAPWQYMRSYGKSEEMLSVINYKIGGNSVCLYGLCIGHMFRTGGTPPYTQSWCDMWRNSVMLADIAYDTKAERDILWSGIGVTEANHTDRIGHLAAAVNSIRDHINRYKSQGRTWDGLLAWGESVPKR